MERPLLYFVLQFVRDGQQALDVLQDVWIKVLRSIGRLQEPRQLRCWLYQQARSVAIDQLRQKTARAMRDRIYAAEREVDGSAAEPDFSSSDAAEVHAALELLGFPHREVLVLHFLEDWSIADISRIVGSPAGTIKSRLFHAKQALAAILKEKQNG
jgi:RNA polymerase sigma-70 factor (ECF subfamily)